MLNVASNRQTATVKVEHAGQTKTMSFDGIVICAGVHGRGQAAAPEVSLLDDETKLVTSRLGDRREDQEASTVGTIFAHSARFLILFFRFVCRMQPRMRIGRG